MRSENPSLPGRDEWRRWNVDVVAELHAGKQSRVFDALLSGERSAIKLTQARLTNIAVLTSRMETAETLGASYPSVVAPTRIDGALVQPIGEWLVTATPFIAGERLDENTAGEAVRLSPTFTWRCTNWNCPRFRQSQRSFPQRPTWTTISGTDGDDVLAGTPGDDIICAGDGDDVVNAGGGNDVVLGGVGNDVIRGDGDDVIRGGIGADVIEAGRGGDLAIGGRGDDFISGDRGNDTLIGRSGNDTILGNRGNDDLRGGRGQTNCVAAGRRHRRRRSGNRHLCRERLSEMRMISTVAQHAATTPRGATALVALLIALTSCGDSADNTTSGDSSGNGDVEYVAPLGLDYQVFGSQVDGFVRVGDSVEFVVAVVNVGSERGVWPVSTTNDPGESVSASGLPATLDFTSTDEVTFTVTLAADSDAEAGRSGSLDLVFDPPVESNRSEIGGASVRYTVVEPGAALGPVAADDSFGAGSDGASFDPTANDVAGDAALDPVSLRLVSVPAEGSLTVTGPGEVTWVPGALGSAAVAVYEICDTNGLCTTGEINLWGR